MVGFLHQRVEAFGAGYRLPSGWGEYCRRLAVFRCFFARLVFVNPRGVGRDVLLKPGNLTFQCPGFLHPIRFFSFAMTLLNLVGLSSLFIISPLFSDHLLDQAVIFRVIFDERSGDQQGGVGGKEQTKKK